MKFEVIYQDPEINNTNFILVVKAKDRLDAANKLYQAGYKPIRVKPLVWGK